MNQPFTPIDIDTVELPKLDAAIDWLVGFVNGKLADSSSLLTKGMESRVFFEYDDFVHSYRYLDYWRDQYRDIAALFREQGWEVIEYERARPEMRRDEVQPALGFKMGGTS